MDRSFKNKNMFVIGLEVLIIILGVGGITFAATRLINGSTETVLKTGEYNVDYVGDSEIIANDLEPISDDSISIDSRDKVIRLEFSLRGVNTNKNSDELIYDVMFSDIGVDCSLLNEYTKWNLYKNGTLLSSGNLDPSFDGNILSDNYRLTTRQESLPEYNDDYDNYVLIMWISESCDDLETCNLIDQKNILNSKISMKMFIAVYSGESVEYTRVPNYDNSCASKPVIKSNMIPVTYVNGEWVVSDVNNGNNEYLWYDYSSSKWANVAIVNDVSKYNVVGTKIDYDDVYGFYVWIPKYRYKLWNKNLDGSDTYNALDNGIDIVFMNNMSSYEGDEYYVSDAFSSVGGFWISKYEISKVNDSYLSVPGNEAYYSIDLNGYNDINSSLTNLYGYDTSIVNNLEYGAVLYLSHSKYGVCNGDGCSSISLNSTYIGGSDKQDTTTRNVYGIYDMAGGSSEYVVSKYKNILGTATDEVVTKNGGTWYDGVKIDMDNDYILRGGFPGSMFSYRENGSVIKSATRCSIK